MIVLAAAVIGVGSFLPAPPAQAYTAAGVCGSGYVVKDSHALGSRGRVYLLWNEGNGYNCVVTLDVQQSSDKNFMSAELYVQGSGLKIDDGEFKYYAGPVKTYGRNKCVYYTGDFAGTRWTSPLGWCGG